MCLFKILWCKNTALNWGIKLFYIYFQALDAILKALSLCSTLETICAKYHEEHGDILKDMEDYEAAEEVSIHFNGTLIKNICQ